MRENLIECLRFCADDDSDCMNCARWDHDCGSSKCVNDLLLTAAISLEEKQAISDENKRWIPVSERLPENDTAVIVATDNGVVFQCLYAYDGWDLWDGYTVNITHWMPLPNPPQEDN